MTSRAAAGSVPVLQRTAAVGEDVLDVPGGVRIESTGDGVVPYLEVASPTGRAAAAVATVVTAPTAPITHAA